MAVSLKPVAGLGAAFAAVVAALFVAVSTGNLRVPLPAPAYGKYVNVVPHGVLPWKPRPLQGVFAPNERLLHAVRLFEGQVKGPESVAFSDAGNMVLLDKYGNMFEALLESGCGNGRGSSTVGDDQASSGSDGRNLQRNDGISYVLNPEPVTRLGAGRPLGSHYDAEANLIVCDSLKGLVKYDNDINEVTILSNRVSPRSPLDPNSEITYTNDLAIASDGKVYFSSCSDIVPMRNKEGFYDTFTAWMLGMAQGLPKGRLMMYDPATQETVVLAKGFYYANGVALSPDEDFLVMCETDRVRVLKYWLKGPKAGTWEPLIEHLPGAPDGVSTGSDGSFWVALVSPVPPIAKLLKDPVVRALYAWLPQWARPPLKKWGAIVKVSGDGQVLDFLMDPNGEHVSSISAAVEHEGCLFMGNLAGDFVSYVDLGAVDKDTCWCSCTCNGKKLETPVRLRPPEGEGGQNMFAGLMANERAAWLRKQQAQQQWQHDGEQGQDGYEEGDMAMEGEGEAAAGWDEDESAQQQQQQQKEGEALEAEEGVAAAGEDSSGGEQQVAAPAPSMGVHAPPTHEEL